jgi:biopolymer transport protein ExbD
MAMAVGSPGGDDGEEEVVSTINTTPLVDVMLVLLIIFLITIPVVTHTVKLELPKEVNIPNQTKPENIVLSVDQEAGSAYPVRSGGTLRADRQDRLHAATRRDRQGRLHHRTTAAWRLTGTWKGLPDVDECWFGQR